MTGTQSTLDINSIIAIKGALVARIRGFESPPLNNRTLFRRDNCMCAYCGHTFKENKLTRDHVMPSARGGPNIWSNVVTACGPCNKIKDCRTPEEANMPLKYQPYLPNRAEYLIHQNKKLLPDQEEFLMNRIGKDSNLLKEQSA
jgi:5-methylcytosine-specific restriction endonuclease McrA